MSKRSALILALAWTAALTYVMIHYAAHIVRVWDDMGALYVRFVFLAIPLWGLGVFLVAHQRRIGAEAWKPVAIAVLFATPLEGLITVSFQTIGLDIAMAEATRSVAVLALMITTAQSNHNWADEHFGRRETS